MKTLKIEKRGRVGKSDAKRLRKEGKIPAVIYGHGEKTENIVISKSILKTYTHEHKEEIIRLGPGKGKDVVIKEIQYDPITDEVNHIDFMHIHKGERLKVSIPIVIDGTSQGVKVGGVLEHWIRQLDIECLPKDIPNEFNLDITELNIGESLHVKDLSIGEGIKVLAGPDDAIVSVMAPRKEEVKVVVEEEEVEEVEEEVEVTEEKEEKEVTEE